MTFKPLANRKFFDEAGLAFVLDTVYDSKRPMGNVAASELDEVLRAWLAGLHVEIAPVISRLVEWLDQAIQQDEQFGGGKNPDFHRETLHRAKALGLWMQNGSAATEVWDQTRLFCLRSMESGIAWPKHQLPTYGLDDYLNYCFQAGQYEAGIVEFEKYHGAKNISIKKALKPRDLAYALCLNQVQPQFDVLDLHKAGRRLLQTYLDKEWLGRGQITRGATWLKIVYWHHDTTLTPLQVILKAYDDMLDVVRPEFV